LNDPSLVELFTQLNESLWLKHLSRVRQRLSKPHADFPSSSRSKIVADLSQIM
jgi:hypothetical protein